MKNNIINKISIINLADEPQYLEEASIYIWNEWQRPLGTSLEDVIYRSNHSIYKDRIPQMHIAKLNNELVGVASIWNNDLMFRQDLIPWLATVFVKKEYRNKGIGNLLQKRCIQVAKEHGYENLYLMTELEGYYEKTGWNFLEIAPLGGGQYMRVYEYRI